MEIIIVPLTDKNYGLTRVCTVGSWSFIPTVSYFDPGVLYLPKLIESKYIYFIGKKVANVGDLEMPQFMWHQCQNHVICLKQL